MKKILIVMLMALLLVSCKNETPKNENNIASTTSDEIIEENILVRVNDMEITLEEFDKYYTMQSYDFEKEYGEAVWNIEQDGKTMTEIRQDQTIDYLIRVKLIENYMNENGIEIDTEALDEAYGKYLDSISNDDEIKAYFEDNQLDDVFLKRFLKDQYYLNVYEDYIFQMVTDDADVQSLLFDDQYIRYKTRHILLDSEETLNQVLSQLNDEENPGDFSDVARMFSIHSTSAVTGGDLGYRLVGTMPKAYEDVALTIEPYTISEPVETEFGYHIIFVDDRQMLIDMIESGMPEEEIESYKSEIVKRFAVDERKRVFNELKEKAIIEIDKTILVEE